MSLIDEAVGAGLAVQAQALSTLDDEQADRLADLLRELFAGTPEPR